jgi:hypothetical protein
MIVRRHPGRADLEIDNGFIGIAPGIGAEAAQQHQTATPALETCLASVWVHVSFSLLRPFPASRKLAYVVPGQCGRIYCQISWLRSTGGRR